MTTNEMNAMRAAMASPRPKTDPEVGSGVAGDARVAAAVADWRRTECVIEGPDRDGLYRIRHAPTGLCWGSWAGNFQDPHTDPLCFMFFYDAPGSGKDSGAGGPADKVLASIPDSARPKAPNTEAALLAAADAEVRPDPFDQADGAEPVTLGGFHMPAEKARDFLTKLADECERSGLEYGKGRATGIRETLREFPTSNVRPVSEPAICRVIDKLAAECGIGNPQAGEGAPILDQFGEPYRVGESVQPCLSPGDTFRIVSISEGLMKLVDPTGILNDRTIDGSIAAKYWRKVAKRTPEPEPEPEPKHDYAAGYSAAMCEAIRLVNITFCSSQSRTELVNQLATMGANVPAACKAR